MHDFGVPLRAEGQGTSSLSYRAFSVQGGQVGRRIRANPTFDTYCQHAILTENALARLWRQGEKNKES